MEKQELRRKVTATILTIVGLCVVLGLAIWLLVTSTVFSSLIQWLMIGCCVLLALAIVGFSRNKLIEIRTLRTCLRAREAPAGTLQYDEEAEPLPMANENDVLFPQDDGTPTMAAADEFFDAMPDPTVPPAAELRTHFETARKEAQAHREAQDPLAQGAAAAVAAAAVQPSVEQHHPAEPPQHAQAQRPPQSTPHAFAQPGSVPVQRAPQVPQQTQPKQEATPAHAIPVQGVPVQRAPQVPQQTQPQQQAQHPVSAHKPQQQGMPQSHQMHFHPGQSAPGQGHTVPPKKSVPIQPPVPPHTNVETQTYKRNVSPIAWPSAPQRQQRGATGDAAAPLTNYVEQAQQAQQLQLAQQQEAARQQALQAAAAERAQREASARAAADAADAAAQRASAAAERAASRLREAAGLPPVEPTTVSSVEAPVETAAQTAPLPSGEAQAPVQQGTKDVWEKAEFTPMLP